MFIWPAHIFNPTRVTARLLQTVISGGTSLAGIEDVIATDGGGRWEVGFEGITLRTPQQIRAWEAWEGHLARGLTDCLVPLLSLWFANRSSHGKNPMNLSSLVANDPVFPTDVKYAVPPITGQIAANASLRATQVRITIFHGAALGGGEKFSVGDRAYRIVRKLGPDLFQIEPPLRAAVTTGQTCVFDWPVVKCRSAPGESWSPALDFGRRGEVSIRFLENAS